MLRTGRTIRSAKMNATTPPKLMPPFHSTAASGTLPIEQTNDRTETSGPTSGPQSLAASGRPSRNKPCQKCCGTQQADRDVDPDGGPVHHEVLAGGGEPRWRAEP